MAMRLTRVLRAPNKMILSGALIVFVVAAVTGCESTNGAGGTPPAPAPKPLKIDKSSGDFRSMEKQLRAQNRAATLEYLRSNSKTGRLGDFVNEKMPAGELIEGVGVVCELNGRGTKSVPRGLEIQKRLSKSLLKEYPDPGTAAKILGSTDSAAVTVQAILPPFAAEGDKVDVRVDAFDHSVNLEGGILAEVELEQFVEVPGQVKIDPMFTYSGRRASRGVQAYARGLVTLIPAIRDGKVVGQTAASTGYLPAGAMAKHPHGIVLRLKQGNACQALLVEYTIAERFKCDVRATDESSVRLTLPAEYSEDWQRFVRVVFELDLGSSGQRATARVDGLLGQLGSGDPRSRERAEYALEGIGNAAAPMMTKALRSSQGPKREALLRVLGQLDVAEVGDELLTEARSGSEQARLEATRLLGRIKPKGVEETLVQLLGDDSGLVRSEAIRSLEKAQAKQSPVKRIYSQEKNFILNWAEVPGHNEVVIYAGSGVRRIDVFGNVVAVNDGFKGEAGVVAMSVAEGRTQMAFKHRPDLQPVNMAGSNLRAIIAKLDERGVSINEILAIVAEMDRTKSLNARVVWLD